MTPTKPLTKTFQHRLGTLRLEVDTDNARTLIVASWRRARIVNTSALRPALAFDFGCDVEQVDEMHAWAVSR